MTAPASLSSPGTLVRARGREWVVLPGSTADLLRLRPLGGLDEEEAGLLVALEPVESASFPLPGAADLGDFASGKLLRDAARLSMRAAAGPFRCFGRIAAEPRPYQLVPLMMALKLDPVRLLIADDVGIGKTIEAALIAREFLDRGEIQRIAVLCPPHLAEQWQSELASKFHIEAELVLSSTIDRLERDLPHGVSLFERHPFTVVSTDFIKSSRRAGDFARACPEFVVVDEAHGCTLAGGIGKGRQQRFALLAALAKDPARHLLLVTATPHSGKEEAFRSLLSLLDPEFADLPPDLDSALREGLRTKLARHLVQRRRADIRLYLDRKTPFPERKDKEASYSLSPAYRALFDDILDFARGYVHDEGGDRIRRVRTWSALALLRCVSSSPAAAAATLRGRAAVDEARDEDIDTVGRHTVLDQDDTDDTLPLDISPGSATESASAATRSRLLELARRAEAIPPEEDAKLKGALKEIRSLLDAGFHPVVFCRFVHTAEYVAGHLRSALPAKAAVECVTGLLPPAERKARIESLAGHGGPAVLVCTDCLSEGINLQEHFDAVLHYDLAWNPTRHEQREGRIDRFGQRKPEVRVVTWYGRDNPVDGVILDVLIRKHKAIKSDLGVTVAVPGSSEQVAEAIFESALLRSPGGLREQQLLLGFVDEIDAIKTSLHGEWENARDRERQSRSRFAQHTLRPGDVACELARVREAIGSQDDVERFLREALASTGVPVVDKGGALRLGFGKETPRGLRQALGYDAPVRVRFDLPVERGELHLGRTSPLIENLATWVLDRALDGDTGAGPPPAVRCGVIATASVERRTLLLLARFRYQMKTRGPDSEILLAEEIATLAATGEPGSPAWLPADQAESLLDALPSRNLVRASIDQQLGWLVPALAAFRQALASVAFERAIAQREAHERVRLASRGRGGVAIEPVLPADILGAYILLPGQA